MGRFIPPVVHAEELAALIGERPDIRLLDVRTPGEYEAAHVHGAYNVPLDTLAEHGAEIRATVAEPIVLVCQSGQRARKAEEALRLAGMPNLHVLDGGLSGWLAAGQPVVRGSSRLSLERQVRIAAGTLAATGAVLALAVNPLFALLSAFVGGGLVFAGVTNRCGLAMVLGHLRYNQPASCDVGAMVRALATASPPTGIGRSLHPLRSAQGNCATN